MKLSFSTNYQKTDVMQALAAANEYGFQGVEIHDISETENYEISDVRQKTAQYRVHISCIDTAADISKDFDKAYAEAVCAINKAAELHCPYVRLHAESEDNVSAFLQKTLPDAEKNKIVLLIESCGVYGDTSKLRGLLEHFASDSLGALWDFYHPYRSAGETPDVTVKNLGAYIKHVHIKDSDETGAYTLIGEGTAPMEDFFGALRSVNYDGYISLEWNEKWADEVGACEIAFPHFVSFMNRFDETATAKRSLYQNKSQTGKFIWKKDALIEKTFSQVLDCCVEEFPNQTAIRYTTLDYTRTYSQFRDDVDEFARALVSVGVTAGSHVAVWATNVPQWYIAFWAVTKIGAVLVSMNTAYKIHEAEYLLKQSDTHTLIMTEGYRDSNYREIMQKLCPETENTPKNAPLHAKRLPFLRNIITVGFEMHGAMTWDEARAGAAETPIEEIHRRAAAVSVHSVCNMQYTSGTTGFPKGVMLTHYNIVNNGKCIGDRMDLSTADRMMIQVPMFHCFGMVLAMTAAMTHSATILPLPYFSPRSALSCIDHEHITCFHGVPTMFIALLENPDFEKTDFSYMRTGIMAGSPCPVSVMQDVLNKMNMREITIVYGQTEASPGCTMSSTDDSIETRVGTVGRALPEIECKITDPETGEEMPVGEVGEFVARGYNIMKGYYKMPHETAAAIDKDGWLHTGDLALKTADGNFCITGRLKDMIIRGGENIYPKEIEEFIYTHPSVKDVQVIGVPDEQYGEEIMACVILKEGTALTADELKGYIAENMAKHKVPRYIDFVEKFPMNVAGKILKYKMREDAIERLGIKKAEGITAQ